MSHTRLADTNERPAGCNGFYLERLHSAVTTRPEIMYKNRLVYLACRTRWILFAAFCSLLAGTVQCAVIIQNEQTKAPWTSLPDSSTPKELPGPAPSFVLTGNMELNQAMRRGLWNRACGIASEILARQEQSLDALRTFALCRALHGDRASAGTALQRLRETDSTDHAYNKAMMEGILHLKSVSSEQAERSFNEALRLHPLDPLALYFSSELLHLRDKDTEAIASFKAVLKQWPEYVPALVAASRLIASPKASREDLLNALSMAEKAAAIDPSNQSYWKQVVDLCDRTAQHDKANAVRLQWLSRPALSTKRLLPSSTP